MDNERLSSDGKVETLRKWRLDKKIKQSVIAQELGISQPMYYRYENDSARTIPEMYWNKLSSILGVSVEKIEALNEERKMVQKLINVSENDAVDLSHLPGFVVDFIKDPDNKDVIMETLLAYMMKVHTEKKT